MRTTDQQGARGETCSTFGTIGQRDEVGRRNPQASYYRARYYDPSAGRFVSEDPIRWFSGTANFYGYVQNDPADLVDPLGLRASKSATADCIANGLDALFPGVMASVGAATKEVGGHWNFPVQLQFPSSCAANKFYSAYKAAAKGWPPPARFGSGPALHLENLGSWGAGASAAGHILSAEQDMSISTIRTRAQTEEGGWVALPGMSESMDLWGTLPTFFTQTLTQQSPWPPPQGCPQSDGNCGNSPTVRP